MKMNLIYAVSMTCLLIILASCKYDTVPFDCSAVSATFTADVQPLISSKCSYSGCHASNNPAAGIALETYTQISAYKNSVRNTVIVNKSMPPSGPLPAAEMSKIQCWIDAGAPNN
jgi:uncharacterized membrane protein